MADFSKETINIGSSSNDGTGDTMRVSFLKTNNNFTELYQHAANLSANVETLQSDLNQSSGDLLLLGGAAFDQANLAYDSSNNLILVSQTSIIIANNASDRANEAGSIANAANIFAYGSFFNSANAHTKANAAFTVANAAFTLANTISLTNATAVEQAEKLNRAYTKANDAYDLASGTYLFSIGTATNAAAGFTRTNTVYGYLNTASFKTNSNFTVTNSSYVLTNTVYAVLNTAYLTTNSAYRHANAAFDNSNNKVNIANGTVTGSFTIQDTVTIDTHHNIVGSGATFRTGVANFGVRIYPGGGSDPTESTLRLTDSSFATLGIFTANNTEVTIGSNTAIPVIVRYNGSQMGRFDNTGLYVSGEVAGFYSDERLKTNISPIQNALEKVEKLKGVTYTGNELAAKFGFTDTNEQVGLLSQDVEKVLPQVIKHAPFDLAVDEKGKQYSISGENYKTVQYEKIVPLLVEAIKELSARVKELEGKK
jgi:hypothetical protein